MKSDPPNPPDGVPHESVPLEILEWARQTFDEVDFLDEVREIKTTGGIQFEDFVAELEARAGRK